MSGGKKKSGFQITSVTTDYGQAAMESQTSSFPEDPSGPPLQLQQPPAGKAVTNGGQSMTYSPSLTSKQSGHAHSSSLGRVGVEGGEGMGETRVPSLDPVAFSSGDITTAGLAGAGIGRVSNGPSLLDHSIAFHNHSSSSQPGSPVTKRKQLSQEHSGSNFAHSSRFRVVRLGQGLGEPYRRGRWTCVDFLEREGAEERGLRRVMDSMRQAHSLESLETVGLSSFEGGVGTMLKPLGQIRALRSGHLVHSQGTTHLLAPHIGVDEGAPKKPCGEGPYKADSPKASPASDPQTFSSGPPSPTHKGHPNLKLADSTTFDASVSYTPRTASPLVRQDSRLLSPTKHPSESVRPRHIPSPLRLDMDPAGKSLLRETRSQPSSPSSILPRDRGFHPSATPIQTPSALSLAQSMFGVGGAFEFSDESVKKIVSAFETRRQPRPLSLPPSLPQSFPSKLSPHKSPKNGSRLPSASSTSPACIHTNPSPHLSPPLSRSSSAPSSPTLRRTACFSVSPSGTNVPPVVLRSSHPNLHLASHKMPSGLHHAPPALPSWPRHPVTPPPLPRQLKLPRGADWQREEGLGSGRAGGGVRSSWPSSRTELCSCGRQRCSEVTERSSPSSSVSCERTGQASCWESLPNPRSPGGPSVSHTQAAFGKTARGAPGDRDTSSACVNRLKTPALPSPIPLSGPMAMPRKQSQIHSPTLTRKYALSVPSQPVTDLGLKPQPYGTHSPDPSAERGLATFTPIKTGVLCPPFLDSAQTQSRGLADRVETDRAPCFGSNIHQSQDRSACPSFRAQGCYWSCSPIDTCDRQTQTPNNAQKDCDLTIYQTGSVGHSLTSKEVQTVNVCSAVSSAQLFSRVAQNPIQISAPSPSQSPGLNSSGTSSTADTGPNSESWAGSASFRDGQNCSSGAFQAQDHNGNKVCLPSSAVNLGSLNNTVGSRDCVVSHDLKVGTSPAASELSSSITSSHPTANPAASVTEAAVQRPFHTTASRTTLQGPMHTSIASGAAVQGPIHTTTFGAALQGPIHTTAIGSAVQPLDHTTASTAALQGPIHTSIACGSAVQGPVHTTACGSAVQGPVHTTACGSAVQLPVHTTACGSAEQLPVHTTARGSAVQLPVHTTACGSAVQGPVHTAACGSAEQGSSTTAVQGDIRGVRTPAPPKTSAPFPDGAENLLHPPEVKPHAGGPEPKEPKPVPVTLTRNSDKAFLSLLLFIHSGSSNSMIAIDNKIEQAMDLVKTHLMMAVREEVEVLREQIKELSERNAQLERENYILRALRERD